MKTNQTATLGSNSTSQTSQLAGGGIVSPVLLDCMAQLKDVNCKLRAFYTTNKDLEDSIQKNYLSIDSDLNSVAYDLSEIMRVEMITNTFYKDNDYE
ncbi:MAG: hypothetical protein RR221_06320 [Alistipes sp.]